MSLLYRKFLTTLREEGVFSLYRKAWRRMQYALLRQIYPSDRYLDSWRAIKGRFKGERAFLIGNGPSLNKTPLHLLRGEWTMCFNRFYLMLERLNWTPDFYVAVDNLVLNDLLEEIDQVFSVADSVFLPDIHFRGEKYFEQIGSRDGLYWLCQKHGQGFSTELPEVFIGGSVIYEGFQILKHLGFEEIYMIGVDMNFTTHETAKQLDGDRTDIVSQADDDPNHFDPRYFGKDRSYHQPEPYVVEFMLDQLDYVADQMEGLGLRIYNAGYDSKVECFPEVEFRSLFDVDEEEELELINQCFRQNTHFNAADEFEEAASFVDGTVLRRKPDGNYFMNADEGAKCVSNAVFSHIPIGPFQGKYYFVQR